MELLDEVKTALRVTTDAYDNGEILPLIESAKIDLRIANIDNVDYTDPAIRRAIVTYCRLYFGQPSDFDRLKVAYDEMKAQMGMATGYTEWSGGDE